MALAKKNPGAHLRVRLLRSERARFRGGRLHRYSVPLSISGSPAGWLRNVPLSWRLSGRATPALCDDPTAARYATNRQEIHLSRAERCIDEADHLCAPHGGQGTHVRKALLLGQRSAPLAMTQPSRSAVT